MTRTAIAIGCVSVALLGTVFLMSAGGKEVCYSSHDEIAGKNRICYYKCPSGDVAITISDTKRCPVNITR